MISRKLSYNVRLQSDSTSDVLTKVCKFQSITYTLC